MNSFGGLNVGQTINFSFVVMMKQATISQLLGLLCCAEVTLTAAHLQATNDEVQKVCLVKVASSFPDSQVMVKITGEDTSSAPTVC